MAHVQHQQVTGWTGWIGLAGFIMALTGIFHIVFGIGGALGSDWYIYASGHTFWFDSSAWGWSMIVGGTLLLLSSGLLLAGNMVGRIMGVILAAASLVANISLFAVAPVWSALVIVFDLMVLYAIIAHGSEMKRMYD